MADDFANASPLEQMVPGKSGGAVLTAGAGVIRATRAIHCNVSETIVVKFVGDSTDTTLVVVAGTRYPYSIDSVTTGTGIVPIR